MEHPNDAWIKDNQIIRKPGNNESGQGNSKIIPKILCQPLFLNYLNISVEYFRPLALSRIQIQRAQLIISVESLLMTWETRWWYIHCDIDRSAFVLSLKINMQCAHSLVPNLERERHCKWDFDDDLFRVFSDILPLIYYHCPVQCPAHLLLRRNHHQKDAKTSKISVKWLKLP